VHNKNKTPLVFNNRQYRKIEDIPTGNYKGIDKYKDNIQKVLRDYTQAGIISEVAEDELHLVQLNPVNLIPKKNGNFTIVLHHLENARYSQPSFTLDQIIKPACMSVLRGIDSMIINDLVSCYGLVPFLLMNS